MANKDVSIKLMSTQIDGETRQETELLSDGTYEKTDKGYKITYEESEATGFEGSVTALEIEDGRKVTMNRTGAVSSNLIVEIGKKHHCVYGTPYGDFTIGVNASFIKSELNDDGGRLEFHYVIDVNSSYVGDFEISIEIKAANTVA